MRMNAITYAAAVFLTMGCSSSSGSGSDGTDESSSGATATDSVDEADSADSTASTSGTDGADGADGADGTTGAVLPQDGTELCAFDPEKAGKDVGGSIENFGLKTYQGDAYWLHQNCACPFRYFFFNTFKRKIFNRVETWQLWAKTLK